MFFGAGNLIFPPFLGFQAGTSMPVAMLGFMISAVCLPILGVIAVARSGGLTALAERVHPKFAFLFTLLIYLSIGPCLAIPRTASTSFEMVVAPLFSGAASVSFMPSWLAQVIYSVAFFLLAGTIALNPERLTQRLGKILSPTLLTLIAVLFAASVIHPLGGYSAATGAYASMPLVTGFIDGYQTMDTLAALNFGLIIALNIRMLGVADDRDGVKETIIAGLLAGVLLTVVYFALSHVGAQSTAVAVTSENGAQSLTAVAQAQFGPLGLVILGAIFFVACLNTCVGLLSCCSNYFKTVFPCLGYRGWLAVFVVTSTVISNAGLTLILKLSIPVLVAIYPVAIVLIALSFLNPLIHGSRLVYGLTMALTIVVSVVAGFTAAAIEIPGLTHLMKMLPLSDVGLEWILPAAAGIVVGLVIDKIRRPAQS